MTTPTWQERYRELEAEISASGNDVRRSVDAIAEMDAFLRNTAAEVAEKTNAADEAADAMHAACSVLADVNVQALFPPGACAAWHEALSDALHNLNKARAALDRRVKELQEK